MCVYMYILKDLGAMQSKLFQSKLKVRVEGWEFHFILWLFFIRDIYNFYNVIFFLRKKKFLETHMRSQLP